MLIGVLSDIHDHLDNLQIALRVFSERGVEALIFCGDFCSPLPVKVVARQFNGDIHCVFGNGDGDRFTILKFANTDFPNLKLYGEYAELELGGRRIVATHYPFYAEALAKTGDYSAVFCGHTHLKKKELIGKCLWLNPGDIMGSKGQATCAIYDTETNSAEFVAL